MDGAALLYNVGGYTINGPGGDYPNVVLALWHGGRGDCWWLQSRQPWPSVGPHTRTPDPRVGDRHCPRHHRSHDWFGPRLSSLFPKIRKLDPANGGNLQLTNRRCPPSFRAEFNPSAARPQENLNRACRHESP